MNTWHTCGGNNQRSGLSYPPVSASTTEIQTIPAKGSVTASPVFDEAGTAYIADRAGLLQAVAEDGRSLWKIDYREGFHASPALNRDGSVLYTASVHGNVMAVQTADGTPIWKTQIVKQHDPRLLADLLYLPKSGLVITSTWKEKVVALDVKSGEVKHAWDAGLTPAAAAAADGAEAIYLIRADYSWEQPDRNGVRLVRISTDRGSSTVIHTTPAPPNAGKEIWTFAAPVLDEQRSRGYFITNILEEGVLHCVDLSHPREIRQKKYARQIQATPCLMPNGHVVVGDMYGKITAYNEKGEPVYEYRTGAAFILGSPVCDATGVVYVGDNEGGVHRVEPDGTGKKLFEAERSIEARLSVSPTGRLFIPCMDGKVYVLG